MTRARVPACVALALLAGPATAVAADGALLWERHCAGCHGIDGRPMLPEVPDLSARPVLLSDQEIVELIREGRGAMPGFEGLLTEEELLALIDHLRTLGW